MIYDLVFAAPAALLAGVGVHNIMSALLSGRDRDRLPASLRKDPHFRKRRTEVGRQFLLILPKSLVMRLRLTVNKRDIALLEAEGKEDMLVDELIGRRLIGLLAGLTGGLLIAGMSPAGVIAGGLFAKFLWSLPLANRRRITQERHRQFARQLPEALDMLALSISSGISFDRGLALYCGRFKNPIADAFKQIINERALGKPRRMVLEEMAELLKVDPFTSAVGAIVRAEKLGVPLADALRTQAAAARAAHEEFVRELSATAPVKMLVPIACLILPALLIIVIGPVLLQFI